MRSFVKPPLPLLVLALVTLFCCPFLFSEDTEQKFFVAKGATVRQIALDLESSGHIDYPSVFILWTKLHPGSPKPGLYAFEKNKGAVYYWDEIRRGPKPIRVTFPEGWTSWQMAQVLAEKGIVSADEFLRAVADRQLEGRLFPDTYLLTPQMPVSRVLDVLTERFDQQKPADWVQQAAVLKLREPQLLVLASIVEREARSPAELPLVAGVFLNRFRKGWYLESCATVQHAIGLSQKTPGVWKPKLFYKDLEISSPFNTYRHHGFPPGAIGNPGRAALEAAAHPAETDAMFFVANGEGTHQFSRYYRDHLKAKRK